MANIMGTSRKLMQALNTRGYNLTFGYRQFMGQDGKLRTMYSINQATWDDSRKKYLHNELYSTTSMVRVVLYLRDLWYSENGWPLPIDQEEWNEVRKGLMN